jgi:hypothetical protein
MINSLHPGPTLRPTAHLPTCMYVCLLVFPLIPFLGHGGGCHSLLLCVASSSCDCTQSGPFPLIVLDMAGSASLPGEPSGMGQHPCAYNCFPSSPCRGMGLGHMCGAESRVSPHSLGPLLQFTAPPPVHTCLHIHFSLISFWGSGSGLRLPLHSWQQWWGLWTPAGTIFL